MGRFLYFNVVKNKEQTMEQPGVANSTPNFNIPVKTEIMSCVANPLHQTDSFSMKRGPEIEGYTNNNTYKPSGYINNKSYNSSVVSPPQRRKPLPPPLIKKPIPPTGRSFPPPRK